MNNLNLKEFVSPARSTDSVSRLCEPDQTTRSTLGRAVEYIERGWQPIPVPHRAKAPTLAGWPNLRLNKESALQHFGREQNIGVLLGEPSNGLTDVDLDCPETVSLAPRFLPGSCRFGRASKPSSHWLYRCVASKTRHFKDVDGSMLVEIRSTGAQTVMPGSVHPTGEEIDWDITPDVVFNEIEASTLVSKVERLAAAALVARHWPKEGSRNDAALALAGALLRNGESEESATAFIVAVAEVAGDEESDERAACVIPTRKKLDRGEPVTGLPRLADLIGEDVVNRLIEWLHLGEAKTSWLEEMNQRYFVVNESGKALIYEYSYDHALRREALIKYTFEDIRKLYMNDRVVVDTKGGEPVFMDKGAAWFRHKDRRSYLGGVVFAPGQEAPPDKLNLWRGFAIQPQPGQWNRLDAHLRDVICAGNSDHYDYLMKWTARMVQNPGEQGGVAVVLRGGRGTGKGTFGNALMKVFGQHAVYVTNSKHLTGNFNAHLRDAVFIFADEAIYAGDKPNESVLKGLITDPYITIEAKHQNAVTAPNMTHILMASNEDWVVPAGSDERRFFVLDVAEMHKQDASYFKLLRDEMNAGGLEAFLDHLLNIDLSSFDVYVAPKTKALAEQKTLSLRGAPRWLHNCLYKGSIGYKEWADDGLQISKSSAYDEYVKWAIDHKEYPQAIPQWAKAVREALPGCVTSRRPRASCSTNGLPEDVSLLPSSQTRERQFVFSGLHACRAAFERGLDADIDWDDGDDD